MGHQNILFHNPESRLFHWRAELHSNTHHLVSLVSRQPRSHISDSHNRNTKFVWKFQQLSWSLGVGGYQDRLRDTDQYWQAFMDIEHLHAGVDFICSICVFSFNEKSSWQNSRRSELEFEWVNNYKKIWLMVKGSRARKECRSKATGSQVAKRSLRHLTKNSVKRTSI